MQPRLHIWMDLTDSLAKHSIVGAADRSWLPQLQGVLDDPPGVRTTTALHTTSLDRVRDVVDTMATIWPERDIGANAPYAG